MNFINHLLKTSKGEESVLAINKQIQQRYLLYAIERYLLYPKSQVGDQVRTSKYKNIFGKGCTPNWSKEVLAISKIKNTVPWIYTVNDLNGEKVVRTFYEKLERTNQKEKVIKRKINNLYVKWVGSDNSFNS